MMHILRVMLSVIVVFSVGACTATKEKIVPIIPADIELTLELKVNGDINPDDNNVPSPLFVRMYELKSDNAFLKAGFLDIYEKDKQLFGGDLLVKHELKHLVPGGNVISKYTLAKEARYIGVYAEFVQYKDAGYKLAVPVVKKIDGSMHLIISVSGNSIKMDGPVSK